jgi:hypothetical protein
MEDKCEAEIQRVVTYNMGFGEQAVFDAELSGVRSIGALKHCIKSERRSARDANRLPLICPGPARTCQLRFAHDMVSQIPFLLPRGVTVAQLTLDQFVMVRIHARQVVQNKGLTLLLKIG